jgi:vancomycin resistance protein VanJ
MKKPKLARGVLIVTGLTLVYSIWLGALSAQNAAGPERTWWATVNLYAPQILWAIVPLLLLIAAISQFRKARWLPLLPTLPLLWVFGPLMGLCGTLSQPTPQKRDLRVMTYNIAGGHGDLARVLEAIATEKPDVLLIQEAAQGLDAALRAAYPKWTVESVGELILATPLPMRGLERVNLPQLANDPWKTPLYTRCLIRVDTTEIAVYNTHLSTPRPALEALRVRAPDAIAQIESNTSTRLYQSVVLSERLIKETQPVLLAGDFNAPENSLICQQILRAGLRDAFSEAGHGYGFTTGQAFRLHLAYARIDHVFVSPGWGISACRVGESTASDHYPLIADLILKR